MTYLTADNATPTDSYRFFAELASCELDPEGIPEYFRTIDVVVAEPTQEAIEKEITSRPWLKGYSLISYWTVDDGCPF